MRNLIPERLEFVFPLRTKCSGDEENIGFTWVVMYIDPVLFDIVAGREACENLDITAIAGADIDIGNMD
jgi:hypothetical protein